MGREVKLGLLFAAGLFLFIWGINYLKGIDIFARQLRIHMVYDEVGGLLETNRVSISGVQIGQVDRIAFHPDGSGRVVVTAIVSRHIPIPNNSKANLAGDLIGEKEIRIVLGDASTPIASGDTLSGQVIPGITEEISRQILPFRDRAEGLMIEADSLLRALNILLNHDNRSLLTESLESFQQTMASLEKTTSTAEKLVDVESERLGRIMEHVEAIARNLDSKQETLDQLMDNTLTLSEKMASDSFLHGLDQLGESAASLERILRSIEAGEGSAGLLLKDEALYHQVQQASEQLDLLLEDIRENPRKYFNISVFGR